MYQLYVLLMEQCPIIWHMCALSPLPVPRAAITSWAHCSPLLLPDAVAELTVPHGQGTGQPLSWSSMLPARLTPWWPSLSISFQIQSESDHNAQVLHLSRVHGGHSALHGTDQVPHSYWAWVSLSQAHPRVKSSSVRFHSPSCGCCRSIPQRQSCACHGIAWASYCADLGTLSQLAVSLRGTNPANIPQKLRRGRKPWGRNGWSSLALEGQRVGCRGGQQEERKGELWWPAWIWAREDWRGSQAEELNPRPWLTFH